MKKHISVLSLMARSSVFKVIFILMGMAAAQVALFLFYCQESIKAAEAGIAVTPLASLFDKPLLAIAFGVAFLLITFFLCRVGCALGAQPGYTLNRLSVSSVSVWLWQAVYNTAVYLVLWLAEVAVAVGLCALYMQLADPLTVSAETALLATYRSDFLHGILPMYDIALWVRNIIFALTMGVVSATFPYKQRRGKFAGEVLASAILLIGVFDCEPGEPGLSILLCIVALFLAAFSLCHVLGAFDEGQHDEEEELP